MDFPVLHSITVGLDIHHKTIIVCVMRADEHGNTQCELKEFSTFKRDLRKMALWIAGLNPGCVVMESTGIYWKSPYVALEKAGVSNVIVANARHVKNVPGRKTDINDAQWLALLARSGLLQRHSFVPPEKIRSARLLSRRHQKLSDMRSAEKNRLHKTLNDAGLRLSVVVSDLHGVSANQMIEGLLAGESIEQLLKYAHPRLKATRSELIDALQADFLPGHEITARQILDHIQYLTEQLTQIEQRMEEELVGHEALIQLLLTMPGISRIAALRITAEIGADMSVFGNAQRLCAWAGVSPALDNSGETRRSKKLRRGNPWLKRLLVECAHAASRSECQFKAKYQTLSLRRGKKKATIAICRKMLTIMFAMLSTGAIYRDPTVDYNELRVRKNAPRWIKELKKYNMLPA